MPKDFAEWVDWRREKRIASMRKRRRGVLNIFIFYGFMGGVMIIIM
jgi:hypothetical protein